jgi:squalene synthase HpnC
MTWIFATHLARYGPDCTSPPPTPAQARQYVRLVTRSHYENFSVASVLLPARLRRHFHAVYAYCRWADDLADESGGGDAALRLLGWWREQLLACYDGKATHPVFLALRETFEVFAIPPKPFLDLLVAFEQDQRVGSYATFDDLLGYCAYSANPVGRLVLYLFGCRDEERGALSDSICTALQLANFWQDVSRDLDIGRVYLPAEDRLRFGVGDEDLLARRFTPAFARLLEFEVDRTRDLFFRGYRLVELVPAEFRPTLELFIEGGVAILARIEQAGYNTLSRRPSLTKWDKGLLVARAGWRRLRSRLGVA